MKVNVIGTACTWFTRNNTSFLLDDKIVFDTPSGSYKDVMKLVNINQISTILISHFHGDHFADMHIYGTRFMREIKDFTEKKTIYGPKGILENLIKLNGSMCAACDELEPENFKRNINFVEIYDGFEFEVEKYKVTSYKMEHGKPETYGFVFENKDTGVKIGFSADTEMCDNLLKILERSNYAFVEMASTVKRPKHLSIEEVEELIKKYPDCKVFPIHTCDDCQEYAKNNNMNYLEDGQVLNLD